MRSLNENHARHAIAQIPLPFRVEVAVLYARSIWYRYMFVSVTRKNRAELPRKTGIHWFYGYAAQSLSTDGHPSLSLLISSSFHPCGLAGQDARRSAWPYRVSANAKRLGGY